MQSVLFDFLPSIFPSLTSIFAPLISLSHAYNIPISPLLPFCGKKAAKSLFCFSLNKGLRSGLIPATICVKFCSRKICFVSLDTLSGDACLTIGIFPSQLVESLLEKMIIRVKFYQYVDCKAYFQEHDL